jgi:Serine-threonine protein kinase 19
MAPDSDAILASKKLPSLVIKKKHKNKLSSTNSSSRSTRRIQQAAVPKRGLPASWPLPKKDAETVTQKVNTANADALLDDTDDALLFANMPCDTLLAMQSLQQSMETRIEIPLLRTTTTGGSSCINDSYSSSYASMNTAPNTIVMMIRGVLECQLHERFTAAKTTATGGGGGSSQNVSRELDDLLRRNQLRQLSSSASSQHVGVVEPVTVYVSTTDYIRGLVVAAAADTAGNEDSSMTTTSTTTLVDWFVRHLNVWTGSRITQSDIEEAWKEDPPPNASTFSLRSVADLVRWLQERQILLAASADHDAYQLWLPGWGSAVLPAFSKARTDALAFLKQSSYKERSLPSVVRRLRHSPIPVTDVLIPWLVAQGCVQRIERPSGPFLKFALDK